MNSLPKQTIDTKILTVLLRHPYFSTLPEEVLLKKIVPYCFFQTFEKGRIIYTEGSFASSFFLVDTGRVRIYKVSKAGQEMTLQIYKSGETFAEMAAFCETKKYPVTSICLENTSVIAINSTAFRTAFMEHPQVYLQLISTLANRQIIFSESIENLALRNVKSRLARYLFTLEKESEMEGVVSVIKRHIATSIGTISETLSRTLKTLADASIIEVGTHEIRILNRKKLQELAE